MPCSKSPGIAAAHTYVVCFLQKIYDDEQFFNSAAVYFKNLLSADHKFAAIFF
jgi:hypothetical protein